MPKAKPDQVVVHRIELQEKERELVAAAIGANLAGKAVQAAGVASFAYVGYIGVKAAFGIVDDTVGDLIQRFKENNILDPENRTTYREEVAKHGSKPDEDFLTKTFHFWTGGLFYDGDK